MKKVSKKQPAGPAPATDEAHWLDRLAGYLRDRNLAAGFRLLDETEPHWKRLQLADRSTPELLLTLAQWVDAGYRDPQFLRKMLDLLPPQERLKLNVDAYVRVRMAEAFHALAVDTPDETISALDVVLRLDPALLSDDLKALAHLWKARAHRSKADYETALEHINIACEISSASPGSQTQLAVIQVQKAWLLFQGGDAPAALQLLTTAEEVLQHTDHYIALGNIESARGRIIRRKGDYVQSMVHFNHAVKLYETSHPHHPNLARAVTNLAFVKRLLALQLKKRIDASASRRSSAKPGASADGTQRALYKQYRDVYQSAIAELERAKQICILHAHHSGHAAALLNAGHLHLDVGDLKLADREATEAYKIAEALNSAVLKARARILSGLIENAHVEEFLDQPEDAPAFAHRAKQYCMEAIALAQTTENKRLLLNAHLALGEVAANVFFNDYDLARRCVDAASALIAPDDADYVVDELNALKSKLLSTVGIDDALREWSQGIVGKSLQEVTEDFAQLVVTRVWLREGRKISRVAKKLAMSPQKVRRLLKHSGYSASENASD